MNISINTVTNAYYQLEKECFISSRQSSGFCVEKLEELLVLEKNNEKSKKVRRNFISMIFLLMG